MNILYVAIPRELALKHGLTGGTFAGTSFITTVSNAAAAGIQVLSENQALTFIKNNPVVQDVTEGVTEEESTTEEVQNETSEEQSISEYEEDSAQEGEEIESDENQNVEDNNEEKEESHG